jgi:trehalose utilization protein
VQVGAGEARLAQHTAWVGSKTNPDRAFVHERMSGTRQLAWRYTKSAADRVKDQIADRVEDRIEDRVKDRIADRVKDQIADRVYKVGRRPDEADS